MLPKMDPAMRVQTAFVACVQRAPRMMSTTKLGGLSMLVRKLSPQEVKLCMGFPADYQMHGTIKQQIWLAGNAVCPPIMAEILKRCKAVVAHKGKQEDYGYAS